MRIRLKAFKFMGALSLFSILTKKEDKDKMANEKQMNTRIQLKHDIEAHWDLAENFIPKEGELIIYDVDTNYAYPRFKVGDGNTNVKNLPFTGIDWEEINAAIENSIDTSLTQSGKAADAKVVGERFAQLPVLTVTDDNSGNIIINFASP